MIESGVSRAYKLDILRGEHTEKDSYYMALYTSDADIGPQTERYTAKGEVRGTGYQAGGKSIELKVEPFAYGAAVVVGEQLWDFATITAQGAMIYNASKGNKVVAVMAFENEVSSVNGKFTVKSNTSQLIRII